LSSILIIISILSCGRKADQTRENVILRLKWLHQAQFAGFYAADQKGFFKESKIDVRLNQGGIDFPAIQMVSGGSEQFGVTGADQIILAREKGSPVVAISVIYRKSPFVYFSLKNSNINKLKDFEGKKIGIKLGGNEELTYRAMIKKAGINPKLIREIPVKYDMTQLFTGLVDAWPGYVINEPIVAREKGYDVNIIWPSDYEINLYADTLFTTENIIKNKPDLVKRFLAAVLKGWKYALENPEEAARFGLLYSDKLNYDHEKAMMLSSIELVKPDDKPIGWMEEERWKEIHNLLLDQGFIKEPVDINKVFNLEFLKEIYKK
jgi:ABC-type nitrate/sulfonate/bicarbonate transport system substrate-binding protein